MYFIFVRDQKDRTKFLKRLAQAITAAVIDKNIKRQRLFDLFAFSYKPYNRLHNFVVIYFRILYIKIVNSLHKAYDLEL